MASLLNQMMWYKGIFITEIYSKSSDYWLHAVCKQVLTARGISCCCSLLRPAFGIISCPVFLCDFVLRRITPPWVSPPAKSIYHYHCKGKLKVYFTSLLKVDSTYSHYMMVADSCFFINPSRNAEMESHWKCSRAVWRDTLIQQSTRQTCQSGMVRNSRFRHSRWQIFDASSV